MTATADHLRSFICFYALDTGSMIAVLPERKDYEFYQFTSADSVYLINHPLEALLHITCEWHRRNCLTGVDGMEGKSGKSGKSGAANGISREDVDDLLVIIGMIIIVGQQCSYLYGLDKSKTPLTGPADGTWRILRKQAGEIQARLPQQPVIEKEQLFPTMLAAVDAQQVRKRARRRIITKRL